MNHRQINVKAKMQKKEENHDLGLDKVLDVTSNAQKGKKMKNGFPQNLKLVLQKKMKRHSRLEKISANHMSDKELTA